jgi:adenylylsulfate kinase-like enzyme
MLNGQGTDVIVALMAPTRECRKIASDILKEAYCPVFMNISLAACGERDTKGLWKKAFDGDIKNFHGVDVGFTTPEDYPWDYEKVLDESNVLILDSENEQDIDKNVKAIMRKYL